MKIRVLPLNNPPNELIANTVRRLQEAFNADFILEPSGNLPKYLIDPVRDQYRAGEVLVWISELFSRGKDIALGIVEGDAYVEGLNFVFGVASPSLKTALVFTDRLKWMADKELFYERVFKEVLHELGHVFGLSHCSNPTCVMSFSNSILDVDRKSDKYCINCFSKLRSLGVGVKDKALFK